MVIMATTRTRLSRIISAITLRTQSSGFLSNGVKFNKFKGNKTDGQFLYSSSSILGVKDYEDYRRSLYGDITHKALLVDAVGTLLVPSQPMAQVLSLSLSLKAFYTELRISRILGVLWFYGLCSFL